METLNQMSNVSITLPNGIKLEGPLDQVTTACEALGFKKADLYPEDKYYESSSKGFVLIKEMQVEHLKNAVLKRINEFHNSLRRQPNMTGKEFAEIITLSFLDRPENKNLLAMIKELAGRS